MSNTLSRKQIQQMRRLSNAKFPMLGLVLVAAVFVIRVPIIKTLASQAQARGVQQIAKVDPPSTEDSEPAETQQVAVDESPQVDSEPEATVTETEQQDQQDTTENNWFELFTQFQPRESNDGFPQEDAQSDTGAEDTALVDTAPPSNDSEPANLDDFDLKHVSQLGPESEDSQPSTSSTGKPALKLHNPSENGGIVYFVVDEKTHSINAGQTLELTGQDQWLIRFHRGGNFGNSRSLLKPGSYSFSVTKKGWELTLDKDKNESR